jgi:hypothetical protein
LDAWVENGFLQDLVQRGDGEGFEVWLTADHGNLECLPAGTSSEGLGIEAAGKRLRRYPSSALREASSAVGITWDDIPGLPASTEPLLFAPDRLAYTSQHLSVSHGGSAWTRWLCPWYGCRYEAGANRDDPRPGRHTGAPGHGSSHRH